MHVCGPGAFLERVLLPGAVDRLGTLLQDRLFSAAGRHPRQFSLFYYFASGVLTLNSGHVP